MAMGGSIAWQTARDTEPSGAGRFRESMGSNEREEAKINAVGLDLFYTMVFTFAY